MQNQIAKKWKKYYRLNNYYHRYIEKICRYLIPSDSSLLEIGSKGGELLFHMPNKNKTGIEFDNTYKQIKHKVKIMFGDTALSKLNNKKFDYILLSHTLSDINDVQNLINTLKNNSHDKTKIVVFYFNFLWKPILDLAEKLGLKFISSKEPNWLSGNDIDNFFDLESYVKIKSGRTFIFPYEVPFISEFLNRFVSQLPIINSLGLINYTVYKPVGAKKDYSVSVIIPARNEAGNMKNIFKKIPLFCKKLELIFVEGNSSDDTYEIIKNEIANYKGPIKASLYKQKGKGKGDAVRLGFSKAKNDILMILDADLTVGSGELIKFYNAIAQDKGEFVMGSRLVYPMEDQAMRTFNIFGNKFFSLAFTYLLDQRIKDTLCGTKVLLKTDYQKIEENRKFFGDFDPFGDFDLIFGASKLNLKILEIPIRYKERTYGTTNISRFKHGFLLLQMVLFAAKKIKFI